MSLLNDEYYKSKWDSVVKIFQMSNLGIAAQSRAGSRARMIHDCRSDLDVIFYVNGDPERDDFYRDLRELLEKNFQRAHRHNVYPGSNNNVVHLETAQGGIFDFVLLTEPDFENQHGNDVEWRRENL